MLKNSIQVGIFAVVSTFFLGMGASAHVRIGTYSGTDSASGAPCSVAVKAVSFENNLRHPLNERIEVQNEGRTWVLRHPAQINVAEGKVGFSGATLEATQGVASGADAAVLTMSHEEGHEGPSEFFTLHHDYRDATQSTRIACVKLTFQE